MRNKKLIASTILTASKTQLLLSLQERSLGRSKHRLEITQGVDVIQDTKNDANSRPRLVLICLFFSLFLGVAVRVLVVKRIFKPHAPRCEREWLI